MTRATDPARDAGDRAPRPQLRFLDQRLFVDGYGNHVTYRGRNMRNWWDVHADFDAVVDAKRGLLLP